MSVPGPQCYRVSSTKVEQPTTPTRELAQQKIRRFSFSICFPTKTKTAIAKCRQFKRFQIFVSSFPSFGRGFDSHRPLQQQRLYYQRYSDVARNPVLNLCC